MKADLINGTIEHFGRLDILCNNAGWMKVGGTDHTEVDELRTMLEVGFLEFNYRAANDQERQPQIDENDILYDTHLCIFVRWQVHVVGPFELCKLAIPELVKNKGNIIMTSSICGMRGFPALVAYSAAKAGSDNLMRSLAGELTSKGVRVNCVK